ncbi:MAG: bifunctional enoyl-CoA hydratase/phosphate acetyltransferase [Thermodesulfobacteriota bacterium]
MQTYINHTFDEIEVGASFSRSHRISKPDAELLVFASGEIDPFFTETDDDGDRGLTAEPVAAAILIAAMINRRLPGPGSNILSQNLVFRGALNVGDELTGTITVTAKREKGHEIDFDCRVNNGKEDILTGTVTVTAPTTHIRFDAVTTPEVILRRSDELAKLIKKCEKIPPVVCAVVHPCDRDSLLGPLEAAARGLITPVLVGPAKKIKAVAEQEGADISPYRLVDTEHSHAAASQAVAMARAGEVAALMKGSLHTDELMEAVVPSATGLRTGRRISHVFVLDVPSYPRLLMITDAAINIAPTAKEKADIIQNAIDLAVVLGIQEPHVAILAAVETVNPIMQATVDAAILCKMADRGQITGGILDGPLAFDNAVSLEAARTKKILSPVAGKADILLAPDLEAGNMLAKQLQYMAGADSAGIVLGTRVPIVLTSRADSIRTRMASTAVMALLAESRRVKSDLEQQGVKK